MSFKDLSKKDAKPVQAAAQAPKPDAPKTEHAKPTEAAPVKKS